MGRRISQTLFIELTREVRKRFRVLYLSLHTDICQLVSEQTELVIQDLETMRNENAVLENERFPEFREMLSREVERTRAEVETLAAGLGE